MIGMHVRDEDAVHLAARDFELPEALCCATPVHAETCPRLYDAIKRQAMYCGFDCDQRALAPLQRTYETQCIVIHVPLELLASFENPADEPRPTPKTDVSLTPGVSFIDRRGALAGKQ